ncbi:MAG TPA: phosphotransferase [Candidatus Binataceae bacterium]|nr:phosphotransferase [Candidatus Binataceae bacterium]
MAIDDRIAQWTRRAIEARWRGARGGELVALRGDVSTRRFWRIAITDSTAAPPSAIVIDLGPADLPLYARALKMYPEPLAEPPWINLHRFLTALGAPVPALYQWSAQDRMLMVEDVGSLSLFDAARANPAKAADLYRDAIQELMRLHIAGTARADRDCLAFQVAYDERLFAWEMNRFVEFGLAAVAPAVDGHALNADLASLARDLGALPRIFSHRDFHGNNLYVQGAMTSSKIRIIDFQDALMAPAAQDLAVLLTTRDTGAIISPAAEERLLNFYFSGLSRRSAATMSGDDFFRSYRMCVLQHALKCIGLFVSLERDGKREYGAFTPHAIAQARRMLALLTPEFPQLRLAFGA